MPEKVAFICVNIAQREGLFFASSPDLSGLYLVGKTLEAVKADVAPMIEQLYQLNLGIKVRADRAVDAESFDMLEVAPEHLRYYAAKLPAMAA